MNLSLASFNPKLNTANNNAIVRRSVSERKISAVGSNVYAPSAVRAMRTNIVHEKLAATYVTSDNGPRIFESNISQT